MWTEQESIELYNKAKPDSWPKIRLLNAKWILEIPASINTLLGLPEAEGCAWLNKKWGTTSNSRKLQITSFVQKLHEIAVPKEMLTSE